MTRYGDPLPRRYFVDSQGRRVLIGLSIEETLEFDTLDRLPALDASGNHTAWDEDGIPTTRREQRWLDLYRKHDAAWRQWMAETRADRGGSLAFVNQDGVT